MEKMDLESGHGSVDSNVSLRSRNSDDSMDNSQTGLMPMGFEKSSKEKNCSTDISPLFPYDLRCPMEEISFGRALYDRSSWLIGLLLFQSCSSYILADNVDLLQSHPAIIFFLTMLVGAGGNAGNQAAVRIIRGMALGLITDETKKKILLREGVMGLVICFFLSIIGLLRVHFSVHTTTREAVAITLSLSTIVLFSIIIGSVLPFFLKFLGFDPMHASTSIQVIMDISGVLITCLISALILKSVEV